MSSSLTKTSERGIYVVGLLVSLVYYTLKSQLSACASTLSHAQTPTRRTHAGTRAADRLGVSRSHILSH